MAKDKSKEETKKRTPNQDELVDRYIKAYPLTAYGLGEFRRYQDGYWPVLERDAVKRELRGIFRQATKLEGLRSNRSMLESVLEFLRLDVSASHHQWDTKDNLIVCKNGTLDIDANELMPHDPKHYMTARIAQNYNPHAECPTFDYAFKGLNGSMVLLKEFCGYALTTDNRYEIALWLLGEPGSGKSTFIEAIKSVLGERCGLLGLDEIESSQFGLSRLPGKTLVINTEQPTGKVTTSHILNAIISGETVTVERKNRDSFEYQSRAKLMWAMNKVPLLETDSGLFRRIRVVEFPLIPKDKIDPEIKRRIITEELEGVFNWMLLGLFALKGNGKFSEIDEVTQATSRFKIASDPYAQFIGECCERGDSSAHRIQASDLSKLYRAWYKNSHSKNCKDSDYDLAQQWKRLGLSNKPLAGYSYWCGIGVKQHSDPLDFVEDL